MFGRNNNNIGFNNMFSNSMNNFYRRNENEIHTNIEQNEENKVKKLPLKYIYNPPTYGIPKNKIVSNSDINEGLFCGICHNLMWDPVEIEGCNHTFCKCCIIRHLEEKKDNCPNCRRIGVKFNKSVAIWRLCQEYKIKCFNEGCKEMPTYSNLEEHLKKCAFKKYICPNKGCNYKGIRSDIKNHLVICEHRLTDCKYCKKLVKFCDLGKHERTECAQEFECEICHKKMTRGVYFSKHNIPYKDNVECLRNAIIYHKNRSEEKDKELRHQAGFNKQNIKELKKSHKEEIEKAQNEINEIQKERNVLKEENTNLKNEIKNIKDSFSSFYNKLFKNEKKDNDIFKAIDINEKRKKEEKKVKNGDKEDQKRENNNHIRRKILPSITGRITISNFYKTPKSSFNSMNLFHNNK